MHISMAYDVITCIAFTKRARLKHPCRILLRTHMVMHHCDSRSRKVVCLG